MIILFSLIITVASAQDLGIKSQIHDDLAAPVSFLPLPVYATLPNEGATYGFMPVFLDSDNKTGRIGGIIAPSATWNAVSHITFTGRYFVYPDDFDERTFQVTYGTRLYREAIAEWFKMPLERGAITHALSFQYRKDPYRRFFGIGKDTVPNDETSYTLDGTRAYARMGYNLERGLNLNFTAGMTAYNPKEEGVLGLKSPFESASSTPGLGGSRSAYSLFGIRYDTRKAREYSTKGFYLEAAGGGALSSVAKSGAYGISKTEAKVLWEETDRVYGAARAYWGCVYGSDIPFYERQSLGGSFSMRGYILDRFIDNGAWTVDFEQRITAAVLQVAGSTVYFRLDPFINVGQVYQRAAEFFERVRMTEGLGIRAFAPPNVLGRIDIARNTDEFNVYVELGYPF